MHRRSPSVDERRPRVAAALLLAAAVIVCLLALWIVAPAPHRVLLPLAVGAPELSPWLTLASGLVFAITLATRPATWTGRLALLVAGLTVALSASPLVRLPSTFQRANAAMHAALGEDYISRIPPEVRERLRGSPLVARDFVRGFYTGRVNVIRVIEGSIADDVPMRVNVYQPEQAQRPSRTSAPPATGRFPIVVQVYGGSWQRGTPDDDAVFASALASKGFVVFAIDYRHAPQWHWPAQIDDVREGLEWVATHAAEFDGDITRVALFGRSAGAQLALIAAYERSAAAARKIAVQAVVSFYGPVDLVEGFRNPPSPDPMDVRSILQAYLGGTADQMLPAYRAASPISYVAAAVPATLLIYGARDHVVEARFGRELDRRLREAGARSVLIEIPWAEHAFDAIPNGISGQLALYYTERFLASELYGRAAAAR